MEKLLEYSEFMSTLEEFITTLLPQNAYIEKIRVLKNNSEHLDSFVIRLPDQTMAPHFYLKYYYQEYQGGESICNLSEEIFHKWESTLSRTPIELPSMDYESCRDKIVYRLINTEKNRELLDKIPSVPFLDLSIIFVLNLSQNEETSELCSIRIENTIMEKWGISTKDLMQQAAINTRALFPENWRPLYSVIKEKMMAEGNSWGIDPDLPDNPLEELFIATNSCGVNGAAVWLYPGFIRELAQELGTNLYILPSSIHEILILKEKNGMAKEGLLQMIREVNQTAVDPMEVLSDNLYYYSMEEDRLSVFYD